MSMSNRAHIRSVTARSSRLVFLLAACLPWTGAVECLGAPAQRRPTLDLASARPLHFEPEAGRGEYVARGAGFSLHVGAETSTLVLNPERSLPRAPLSGAPLEPVVLRFRLIGANGFAPAVAAEPFSGRSHYYRGSDRSRWRIDVPHFGRVRYEQVYSGTDLVFYGRDGRLEHDFVLAPGSDPRQIRFVVEGADQVAIDATGDVVATTPAGIVRQKAPVAYQVVGGQRREVESAFVMNEEGEIGFRVGAHDSVHPLVIDPALEYLSFLGGSGADWGLDLAIAPDGSLWMSGGTYSTDLGAPVNVLGGDQDGFVSHLTPDGQTLLSTTYIGSSGADFVNRLKATYSGVYVVGATVSSDFPTPDGTCTFCRNPPPGIQPWQLYDPRADSQNVLLKLDDSGLLEHAIVYGSEALDHAWVLALDGPRGVHVGSNSCGDGFPTTPRAFRRVRTPAADPSDPNNECDVTIARFRESASGFNLTYGTYVGGSGGDFVAGIAVASAFRFAGGDWVVGGTTSVDFPTRPGAAQPASAGGSDAFLMRLSADGRLAEATYLGGSGYDYAFDVAVDPFEGAPIVVGRTDSANFPTTTGAFQRNSAGGSDGFVTRLRNTGLVEWSTLLGGNGFDWPFSVVIGRRSAVYVGGQTDSPNFPTRQPIQSGPGGATDGFVTKVDPTGSSLSWSTYLGGVGADQIHGLAVGWRGGVWAVGATAGDVVATPDAAQPVFAGGGADALLACIDAAVPRFGWPGYRRGSSSCAAGGWRLNSPGGR